MSADAGRVGWREVLQPEWLPALAVMLAGILLHSMNVMLVATVLPSIVADIGDDARQHGRHQHDVHGVQQDPGQHDGQRRKPFGLQDLAPADTAGVGAHPAAPVIAAPRFASFAASTRAAILPISVMSRASRSRNPSPPRTGSSRALNSS